MHANMNVAELVALLQSHGISLPEKAQAASETANSSTSSVATAAALSSSAAAATTHANTAMPAIEPMEAPADKIGFIRCTNCLTQLALYAADADALGDNEVENAPAAANVALAAANVVPVAPAILSNRSLSPRWYAVICAHQVGVMYARWDPIVKDLVDGVPHWTAVRYHTK
ncbi:hypothetical protein BDN71DRAFT_1436927 [Pleurotus eryngii]|uniref:Uncharacterized protein n=1 Tax=Pleurotus eryngii TaxID=5323 RepID=A0A9P6D929_PLEER|nr:hypothetical protein BDN71DRAFT_1436927 [Pleurotus eryngii]